MEALDQSFSGIRGNLWIDSLGRGASVFCCYCWSCALLSQDGVGLPGMRLAF